MKSMVQQLWYRQDIGVRMIVRNGEPWWVLADVCRVLEVENSRDVTKRLDDDEKDVHVMDTLGGPQNMTIINEPGLYRIVFRSDKPQAKTFSRWVTHEVLPSIRLYGFYSMRGKAPEPDARASGEQTDLQSTSRYLLLTLRIKAGEGKTEFTNTQLMRMMGIAAEATLRRARNDLIEKGLLEYTPGAKGRLSVYKLTESRPGLDQPGVYFPPSNG